MPMDDALDDAEGRPAEPFRILLIEDDDDDATLVSEYVREMGDDEFELHRAARLKDGLVRIADHAPDIVLLDLHLPDSMGVETIRAVCEACREHASPLVFVLTGQDDGAMAREAVEDCASGVLLKDEITPKNLLRTLRLAVHRQGADRLREIQRRKATGPDDVATARKIASRADRIAQVSGAVDHAASFADLSLSSQAQRVVVDALDRRLAESAALEKRNRGAIVALEHQYAGLDRQLRAHELTLTKVEQQQGVTNGRLEDIQETLGQVKTVFIGDGERPGFSDRLRAVEAFRQAGERAATATRQNRDKILVGVACALISPVLIGLWKLFAWYVTHIPPTPK